MIYTAQTKRHTSKIYEVTVNIGDDDIKKENENEKRSNKKRRDLEEIIFYDFWNVKDNGILK